MCQAILHTLRLNKAVIGEAEVGQWQHHNESAKSCNENCIKMNGEAVHVSCGRAEVGFGILFAS